MSSSKQILTGRKKLLYLLNCNRKSSRKKPNWKIGQMQGSAKLLIGLVQISFELLAKLFGTAREDGSGFCIKACDPRVNIEAGFGGGPVNTKSTILHYASRAAPNPAKDASGMMERGASAKILHFGVISGIGWSMDTSIFLALIHLGLTPFIANVVGASVAVTFVYFVSTWKVFFYHGRWLYHLFIVYVMYQCLSITVFSQTIEIMIHAVEMTPLIAKIFVTPITFITNYYFMAFLLRRKNS